MKPLWALFWRSLLLTPIVVIFGGMAFVGVVVLTFMPPFFAVIYILNTNYLLAVLALAVWSVWRLFGGRLRQFVFEGFEHGSL